MLARNGAGGGNVVGTIRHQFSNYFWLEVSSFDPGCFFLRRWLMGPLHVRFIQAGTSILHPRVQTAKATYTFDQDT
jgi:hypothetical protein